MSFIYRWNREHEFHLSVQQSAGVTLICSPPNQQNFLVQNTYKAKTTF